MGSSTVLVLLAVLVAAATATATSGPVFALQWSTSSNADELTYPAVAPFRNGDVVGFAAIKIEGVGSYPETYSVCEFYNIMESAPSWCYGSKFTSEPTVLGGSDNSVFAALVNASETGEFFVARWVSDPSSSTPAFTVTGNQTGAALGLSGNGDVLAVIEPVNEGQGAAVSLYATTNEPFASGYVPLSGQAFAGANFVTFGSPAPVMFLTSGHEYAVVSTFTATAVHTGETPGWPLDSCLGGEFLLTITDTGLVALFAFQGKTNTWLELLSLSAVSVADLSDGCTTAAFYDVNTGLLTVYNLTRAAATLAASVTVPTQSMGVFSSDSGAAIIVVSDSNVLYALPAPYTGPMLKLAGPSAGGFIDPDRMLVFEPPAPNGVLAYVVGISQTSAENTVFLAVVNATSSL